MKALKTLSIVGLLFGASMMSGCTLVGAMIDHALFHDCIDAETEEAPYFEDECPTEETTAEFREDTCEY
ncbi:MAG: hypothetical protein ACYTDT_03505 [Planctomycetota bacterium]|jgi:hypothetical protein